MSIDEKATEDQELPVEREEVTDEKIIDNFQKALAKDGITPEDVQRAEEGLEPLPRKPLVAGESLATDQVEEPSVPEVKTYTEDQHQKALEKAKRNQRVALKRAQDAEIREKQQQEVIQGLGNQLKDQRARTFQVDQAYEENLSKHLSDQLTQTQHAAVVALEEGNYSKHVELGQWISKLTVDLRDVQHAQHQRQQYVNQQNHIQQQARAAQQNGAYQQQQANAIMTAQLAKQQAQGKIPPQYPLQTQQQLDPSLQNIQGLPQGVTPISYKNSTWMFNNKWALDSIPAAQAMSAVHDALGKEGYEIGGDDYYAELDSRLEPIRLAEEARKKKESPKLTQRVTGVSRSARVNPSKARPPLSVQLRAELKAMGVTDTEYYDELEKM